MERNRSSGFCRIFTEAFLLFLAPVGGTNPAGGSKPVGQLLTITVINLPYQKLL